MIKPILFNGNITSSFGSARKISTSSLASDSFEMSTESRLEKAKNEARKKIVETLKEKGIERGIIILEDGTIYRDKEGNSEKVTFSNKELPKNAVSIHGHPNYCPLSSGDIAVLVSSDLKSQEAVTENGDFSRLTKGENFVRPQKPYMDTACDIEELWHKRMLDNLGIDYSVKKEHLLEAYKGYMNVIGRKCSLNDEELLGEMKNSLGIDIESPDAIDKLSQIAYMPFLLKGRDFELEYGRSHIMKQASEQNKEKIDNYYYSKEGHKAEQEFVKDMAQRYGLIYETNMNDELLDSYSFTE